MLRFYLVAVFDFDFFFLLSTMPLTRPSVLFLRVLKNVNFCDFNLHLTIIFTLISES